ncbi:MAG: phospholipid carrier-dependent glycosyltransferase, partial [Anaerolineales bacterium]
MEETRLSDVNTGGPPGKQGSKRKHQDSWIITVLLIGVLLLGGYFRFIGLNWDGNFHLHPDERFLTMVSTAISFPQGGNGFFDTANSSLNPHNRGYGFYVYGTLPLFLVRILGEVLDKTGYDQIHLVGRFSSAAFDLLTVLLVYLIASRLYRRKRLGLLAAAFSAFAVLQIQLSHYYTVDTFANFFVYLGVYFAIHILTEEKQGTEFIAVQQEKQPVEVAKTLWRRLAKDEWENTLPFAGFGLALGMALACKISAVPMALILPAAAYLQFLQMPEPKQKQWSLLTVRNLALAVLVGFIAFRIFQPYAFKGPGFFGVGLNQRWLDNLAELSRQSNGDVDFPPALQWARRPITFAWENMVLWGLGLPLGLLAWGGFLWMGWRILKGEVKKHTLIWGWTAVYFVWQSLNFSRSMRYQLPVYPTLAIIAAWAVFTLWEFRPITLTQTSVRWITRNWYRILAGGIGAVVLIATFLWAYAFTQIYQRPV